MQAVVRAEAAAAVRAISEAWVVELELRCLAEKLPSLRLAKDRESHLPLLGSGRRGADGGAGAEVL